VATKGIQRKKEKKVRLQGCREVRIRGSRNAKHAIKARQKERGKEWEG